MFSLFPPEDIIDASILLPLSKSESARTLVIDAVAGLTTTAEVADCDDTRALRQGLSVRQGNVNVGAAGTAMRFLTAFYAATPGADVVLDGTERMRLRPLAPLVDALRSMGANIDYTGREGHPPVHIRGTRLTGGSVEIDAGVSSQFISALMMVSPLMSAPLQIKFQGYAVSTSYLRLTALMMGNRGVEASVSPVGVTVEKGSYNNKPLAVGRDWSAASYWYTVSALNSGWIALPGLELPSPQGDAAMARLGQRFGVETAEVDEDDYPALPEGTLQLCPSPEVFSRIDWDALESPDLVPTVVVTAAMLGLPFHITGVKTLHDKETDRVTALRRECAKLGVIIEEDSSDSISWDGRRMPFTEIPVVDTYEDHRMAMAFAPCALYVPGMCIRNPEVVTKSYPDFWNHLTAVGFKIMDIPDDTNVMEFLRQHLSGGNAEGGEQ